VLFAHFRYEANPAHMAASVGQAPSIMSTPNQTLMFDPFLEAPTANSSASSSAPAHSTSFLTVQPKDDSPLRVGTSSSPMQSPVWHTLPSSLNGQSHWTHPSLLTTPMLSSASFWQSQAHFNGNGNGNGNGHGNGNGVPGHGRSSSLQGPSSSPPAASQNPFHDDLPLMEDTSLTGDNSFLGFLTFPTSAVAASTHQQMMSDTVTTPPSAVAAAAAGASISTSIISQLSSRPSPSAPDLASVTGIALPLRGGAGPDTNDDSDAPTMVDTTTPMEELPESPAA
jgi:hypothetical protein